MLDYKLLQWLLIIGIVIIAAIYFYTKNKEKEDSKIDKDIGDKRIETSQLDDNVGDGLPPPPNVLPTEDLPSETTQADSADDGEAPKSTILALNVCAPTDTEWSGDKVMKCALASHLRCGDKNVFEYTVKDESDREVALFYVANFINPGTFDWDNVAEMKVKGLSLFAPIPTPLCSAKETLTRLIDCGQQLADKLGAVLCDDKRESLNKQSVKDMYARCKEYDGRG